MMYLISNARWSMALYSIFVGIILFTDFALAENKAVTPAAVYAKRNTEAQLPCLSDAPVKSMAYHITSQPASIRSRIYSFLESGSPNLLMMAIQDVQPTDAGKFTCVAGGSQSEVELVVYDPHHPSIVVWVTSSNDVVVKWTHPKGPRDAIAAYKIYVTEETLSVVEFKVDMDPSGKQQQYILEDLKPGAIYDIKISALYKVGPDDTEEFLEGPKSPKARVQTPEFSSPPVMVKVVPWRNSTIMVTWEPPTNVNPKIIDGYKVVYKAAPMKKNSQSGEVNVTSPDADNRWKVVLSGLKTRTRYAIAVYAVQNDVTGKKSRTVVFRHDGFAPELSVRAFPLGPDTALVTLETIGGNDVKKLRVLYSDDSATTWKRIVGCKVGRHCIVTGLQPRSKYYFSARARVDRKSRHAVTHIVTPPTGLDVPLGLKVEAQTDHSIKAQWKYEGKRQPIGYVLQLEVKEDDEKYFRPFAKQVVFGAVMATADDLRSKEQYRARVVPFDGGGMGTPSDSVLFSISPTGLDATAGPVTNPPTFIEVPENLMQVDAGENVSLSCMALGVPLPMVKWVTNGTTISQPMDSVNKLYLHDLQETMIVTCEARNDYGAVFHDVKVEVSRGIENVPEKIISPLQEQKSPFLTSQLPNEVNLTRGDPIHFVCQFIGEPTPIVRWYQMGQRIGRPSKAESVLMIPRIEKSTVLRCEGINIHGMGMHEIKVNVKDADAGVQKQRGYSVSLRYVPLSRSGILFKWVIDQGDLDDIRLFDVTVGTDSGLTLMRETLTSNQRLIRLQQLTPGARYVLNLKTRTSEGVVDDSNLAFTFDPSEAKPVPGEPQLSLEVVEIRQNRARVDFTSQQSIRSYRLRVKDLGVRRLGNTILDRNLPGTSPSINLERLKSNRRYQVLLEGITRNRDTLSASVIFVTPPVGGVGVSVASQSGSGVEEPTTNAPPPPITETSTITTVPTTVPNVAHILTTPEPHDDSYELRVKTTNKTPYQVDIRWTVDRGDLSTINNFLVKIKGQGGYLLLQQQISGEQRSITIQSLSTTTKYFVHVQARSRDGSILADSNIAFVTPSADAVVDTSNPFLDLEANEVRSSSTRLEWAVVNGDPGQVRGYRLKVLDRNPSGANLLTQNMASNSQSINLRSLPASRQFYVIVEALGRDGRVMMTSSLTFSTSAPGRYGTTVRASARTSPRDSQQFEMLKMSTTPESDIEPVLDMEIRPQLPGAAKINWIMKSKGTKPATEYQFIARIDDENGEAVYSQRMPLHHNFLVLSSLQRDVTYFLELKAIDRDGQTLAKASTTYRLPPPGHTVEPVKASSSDGKAPENPFITYVAPVNSSTVIVGWKKNQPFNPTDMIMLRYAEFQDNTRTLFETSYSSALPGKTTIADLKPGTKYGFQIARLDPGSKYTQWSDLVFYETAL